MAASQFHMITSFLVMFFSLCLLNSTFAAPVTHVFLIMGQSNSVGYNSDGSTSEDTTSPNIQQLNCCGGDKVEEFDPTKPYAAENCTITSSANDPLLHVCSGVKIGFGMSFARAYNATIPPGDNILLVAAGLSGTGFIDGTWVEHGPGFQRAIARANTAMNLASNPILEGVLWHQGECDAGDNLPHKYHSVSTDTYIYEDIIPMVTHLRSPNYINKTSPTLPFVVGQLLPSWVYNISHPERYAAGVGYALDIMTLALNYSGYASSDGLLGDPVYRSGLDNEVIHFLAEGQRILGRRYFQGWLNAKNNTNITNMDMIEKKKQLLTEI